MKFDIRYANHPDDSKHYDTKELREKYLIEKLFEEDEILLTYSHQDRIIAGGAMPVKKKLSLGTFKELATAYFLERREMGVINIGGAGKITLDKKVYEIGHKEGIYIGMGTKEIEFASDDAKNPAKFYINSSPAHKAYPTVKIVKPVEGRPAPDGVKYCVQRHLGTDEGINKRTINQFMPLGHRRGHQQEDYQSVHYRRRVRELSACNGYDRTRYRQRLEHASEPYSREENGSIYVLRASRKRSGHSSYGHTSGNEAYHYAQRAGCNFSELVDTQRSRHA